MKGTDADRTHTMAIKIKKIDQQRHELKALRFLLDGHPESVQEGDKLPSSDDFQIRDNKKIFDVLVAAPNQAAAMNAIEELDLEDTETQSFLRLNGRFYHDYPRIVKERGGEFRRGDVVVFDPNKLE